MANKHFAVVVGARPNFVKAAPLLKKFTENGVHYTLIHTGQHYDANMSDVFFKELGLPAPDVRISGDIFAELRRYFGEHKFDGTIVFGDVDSSLAGAVAAFTTGQDVFHIEAGLRSFDERMPEERNRKAIDHLSKLHFVTEPSAIENLAAEGIIDSVVPVGNLMIESLEMFQGDIERSDVISRLGLEDMIYAVLTLHRRENVMDRHRLKNLLSKIATLSKMIHIVFPMHPNTRKQIAASGLWYLMDTLQTVEPLGYFDFMKLVSESMGVITDSGGIQEETTHLGIACCTLRDNTERPITTAVGSNQLFPEGEEDVFGLSLHIGRGFELKPVPMWDTQVSQRIYERLISD